MLVLALDTSSPATSCALVELASGAPAGSGKILAESLHLAPTKAGDVLPDALAALCAQAGRALDEVGGLAVGLGPGSFTGLRVGLASAKGLAYALRIPLAGASSLRALAMSAARQLNLMNCLVAPSVEARRGELFVSACSIDPDGLREVSAERVLAAREVGAWLAQLAGNSGLEASAPAGAAPDASPAHGHPRPLHLVGPGAARNLALMREAHVAPDALRFAELPLWPAAAALAELCAPALWQRPFDAAALFALAPRYLAESEPEKALAEGRVGKLAQKVT